MPEILYEDKIRLNFAQSLVASNINDIHKMEKIGVDEKNNPIHKNIDIQKFGLFETATPNFLTYYPDVTPSDLVPLESDFVKPVFRALSEVIVNKRFMPVDFAKNGVLKSSINKLIGQTVYANHEASIGNEIGSVSAAVWQNSYTTDTGIIVPAGINATFKIDGKSHPNIARKLTMDPPAIHSNSVTVQFAWEQSHPKMDQNEFMNKIGTYAADKQLVRKIASDIKFYHETSLVSHGADAYAQLLDKNGKIINPNYADGIANLSADSQQKASKLFYFSYKDDVLNLTADITIPKEPIITKDNNPTENLMNKKFLTALALIYGFTAVFAADNETASFTKGTESLDIEGFEALIKKSKEDADTVATLQSSIKTLTDNATAEKVKADAIQLELTNLKASNPEKGAEAFLALVSDITASYRKLKGDKADADWIAGLSAMDIKALKALDKEYTESLEAAYPLSCKSCGSTEVQRNSVAHEDDDKTDKGKFKIKSNADVLNSLTANHIDTSLMHGKTDVTK